MARSHARLFATIWDDDDFIALPPGPQRMYMFLISQRDLQHCGVIALRERRWSKKAAGQTADDVRADLEVLADHRFVVIDDDAEELLVRSLMRRDKVYAQPNVFKAAVEQIRGISSGCIKEALIDELRRLPVAEIKGDARRVYEELLAEITPPGRGNPTPPGRGSGTPSPTTNSPLAGTREPGTESATSTPHVTRRSPKGPLPDPGGVSAGDKGSGSPSGTPSEQVPSEPRGKGSSYGEQVVVPLSPEPLPVPPSAGADAPRDEEPVTAQTIVGEWIERCARRPPGDVIGQISKRVKAMLDEGIHPDFIRRGLAEWMTRDVHPSVLPSLVNSVMNASNVRPLRATGTDGRPAASFAAGSGARAYTQTAEEIENAEVNL